MVVDAVKCSAGICVIMVVHSRLFEEGVIVI